MKPILTTLLLSALPILASAADFAPGGDPLAGAAPAPAVAASEVLDKKQIRMRLLADATAIVPGKTFRIAAQFTPAEGWHAYHRDPGEGAERPVKVEFEPVPGLTFGAPRHPVPARKVKADTVSQFYEGEAVLIVPVTVAPYFKSDTPVALNAKLGWQVCDDKKCLPPGSGKLALTLPVAAEAKPANEELFRTAAAKLPAPASKLEHVKAAVEVLGGPVKPGGEFTVKLILDIEKGWHIQSHAPLEEGYVATEWLLEIPPGFERAYGGKEGFGHRPAYPAGKVQTFKSFGKVSVYDGRVEIVARLKAKDDLPADAKPVLRTILTVQACNDETCLFPTKVALPVAIPTPAGAADLADEGSAAAAVAVRPEGGPPKPPPTEGAAKPPADKPAAPASGDAPDYPFGLFLLFGLLAGFILNFMPCVLPVLGLKVLSFVQQGGDDPRRAFKLSLAFAAGLLLVFEILAGLAVGAGQAWGELFGRPWFTLGLSAVVLAFALSLFGVWTMQVPGFVNQLGAGSQEGYGGAFFKGMLTTLLATPCTGPFLGSLTAWSVKQSAPVVFLTFSSIGLGMALPYLVLTANPALMKKMPRPGRWMEKFERLMGFVLLATVLFFVSNLYAYYAKFDERQLTQYGLYTQYAGSAVIGTLGFLTAVALAVWVITQITESDEGGAAASLTGWGAGLLTAAAGYFLFFGYLTQTPNLSPFEVKPEGRQTVAAGTEFEHPEPDAVIGVAVQGGGERGRGSGDAAVAAAKTLRERVLALVKSGKTVHVDFTAEWCLNCKEFEARVLRRAATKDLFKELGVVTVVADWTVTDDAAGLDIKDWINSLGYQGIPLQAIYPAGKPDEPITLSGSAWTMDQFHEKVRQAGPSRGAPTAAAAAR
jgi:thiol:disulfide interchange protein DsbD